MSGRKQSEVVAVLKQGEQARGLKDAMYSDSISSNFEEVQNASEDVNNILTRIQKVDAKLSPEASKMFGEKGQLIEKRLGELKLECEKSKINCAEAKNIQDGFNFATRRLKQADEKAEKIRNDIRGKSAGYCDKEYSQAKSLVLEYRDINKLILDSDKQMREAMLQANRSRNNVSACEYAMKDLCKQIDEMNTAARSQSYKENIQNIWTTIKIDEAQKFMRAEYNNLDAKLKAFMNKEDTAVLNDYESIFQNVVTFKSQLEEKVRAWEKEKQDAEDYYSKIEELTSCMFYDPEDYHNNNEDVASTQRYALFEYCKIYGNKDFGDKYQDVIAQVNTLMEKEEFVQATTTLKKADDIVNNAREFAADLQKNMISKSRLALDIAGVMAELNYEVSIDGLSDNPNDGYCITCCLGDAEIKFDEVNIDDDGNVIVNIDHTEGTTGNCHNVWPAIIEKMRANHIPITDVTKNGVSIFKRYRIPGPDIPEPIQRR